MHSSVSRRHALQALGATTVALASRRALGGTQQEDLPPVRQLTQGPLFHWFGYYDKLQFDPTNRYVLSNEVPFEHRTPLAADTIRIGMIDTQRDDQWIPLGQSKAWGWQQGCMLQWRPQSPSEIVWNDRQDDQHVSRILDVETQEMRTLPRRSTLSAVTASGRSPQISRDPTYATRLRLRRLGRSMRRSTSPGRVGDLEDGYGDGRISANLLVGRRSPHRVPRKIVVGQVELLQSLAGQPRFKSVHRSSSMAK